MTELSTGDHLEAVAVVEVATHDRANRIEPGTREHDETRPHPRLVLDADPDAILDVRRILRGRLGDSEREEASGSDQEREAMRELSHLVVGLKYSDGLGPTTTPDDAIALAGRLNPDNEPGRLTFITRMGAGRIRDALPPLVEKVTAAGVEVAWVCDPMHGNTFEASSGYKTRRFDDVIEEVAGLLRRAPRGRHLARRRPRRAHR